MKFDQIDLPPFPFVVPQQFFELNRKIHQPEKEINYKLGDRHCIGTMAMIQNV